MAGPAPRLTIEFAGDTPIYESETGRWCLWDAHEAEVAAVREKALAEAEEALREKARSVDRIHTTARQGWLDAANLLAAFRT